MYHNRPLSTRVFILIIIKKNNNNYHHIIKIIVPTYLCKLEKKCIIFERIINFYIIVDNTVNILYTIFCDFTYSMIILLFWFSFRDSYNIVTCLSSRSCNILTNPAGV